MPIDFSVEPEFQAQLDWIREFVETEAVPLDLAFGGEAADFLLVAGEGEALVKGAGDLALQLTDTPLIGSGLDLIEAALVRRVDGEQGDVL